MEDQSRYLSGHCREGELSPGGGGGREMGSSSRVIVEYE